MSTELVTIAPAGALAVQQGGLGLNFNSKLFELKPATLSVVQPNSTGEGAQKGHLRIAETGDQWKEMRVVLLDTPIERRAFYVGESGQLNRTPENLFCFSDEVVRNEQNRECGVPSKKAKHPQSPNCGSCPKASWDAFRAAKDKGQIPSKDLIPPCDAFYYMAFIDTEYQMPLQMFIRSKSKQPFEQGMKNLSRRLAMIQAKTKKIPNVFDVSFTLKTKLIQTGKFPSYVLDLSDFQGITPEERETFGDVFATYIAQKAAFTSTAEATPEQKAASEIADNEASIDNAVLEGTYEDVDGDGNVAL